MRGSQRLAAGDLQCRRRCITDSADDTAAAPPAVSPLLPALGRVRVVSGLSRQCSVWSRAAPSDQALGCQGEGEAALSWQCRRGRCLVSVGTTAPSGQTVIPQRRATILELPRFLRALVVPTTGGGWDVEPPFGSRGSGGRTLAERASIVKVKVHILGAPNTGQDGDPTVI